MKKSGFWVLLCSLFLILTVTFTGCGGGGGSSSTPAPRLSVTNGPSFDFGSVTIGKSKPLSVEVCNDGNAALAISGLTLSNNSDFALDISGDSACSSLTPSIPAGSCCSIDVTFAPTAAQAYNATLQVESNAANNSNYSINLSGTGTPVSTLSVTLNQIDATDCANPIAYVAVTDQNGFSVNDLEASRFLVTEDGVNIPSPPSVVFTSEVSFPIAAALVMDYSNTITTSPNALTNMEEGAGAFVGEMAAQDQAAIVKFATEIQVVQDFTNDKQLLDEAIAYRPDLGRFTALYDAIYEAVDKTALATGADRMAVIVMTDGLDNDNEGPASTHTVEQVIARANEKGVPVFTIGLGSNVDPAILQNIADSTGGQYLPAPTPEYLKGIYLQLAEILHNQYKLTWTPSGSGNISVAVTVTTSGGVTGGTSNALTYATCP